MNILRVACLQIEPTDSLEGNLKKGLEYCDKVVDTDIILFPEMFSNGYDIYKRPFSKWVLDGIEKNSRFISSFKDKAKELNVAIGITYLEKTNSGVRNSMILFDRFGNEVMNYAKVHTCKFSVEKDLEPGSEFYVSSLDTLKGDIMIGSMICYDREFPESCRILMLKGAEVVLVPNACPMEINRLSQLRGRAYENMLSIVTCNYPSSVDDCNGHSSCFDGVAYFEGFDGSRDTCIMEATGDEGIYYADIDLDMLRKYRKEEIQGDKYRRPKLYQILIEENK